MEPTVSDKKSKHLEGQLGPPVSDEKVYVTKNEYFLKLCQEGQLRPPVSDEKVYVRKKSTFSSCPKKVSWNQFELSGGGANQDDGKRPNVLARNASWPDNPRSAARRAAQDLVYCK